MGSKIAVAVISVLVLLATHIVFMFLHLMQTGGIGGSIGFGNLIITCIFLLLWLLVLIVAFKYKSRLLLTIYKSYWLTVAISSIFFLIGGINVVVGADILGLISFALYVPLMGVLVWVFVGMLAIPWLMLLILFYVKRKFPFT